jgi:hypothetical protein
MGTIQVLGLGPSLDLYTGGISIGVNDIWSRVKTDYVVCVDHPDRFTCERLKHINEAKPIKFFSQLDEYSQRPDFERIVLQPYFPNHVCQINIPQIPKSLCSPFIACVIADKLGYTDIHVYGVDLINHPHLKNDLDRIKTHFKNLKVALVQSGCQFTVHGDGALKHI